MSFIVMGGNGGIGENLALRLHDAGHGVIATMRNADAASEHLTSGGIQIKSVDVSNPETISNAFEGLESVNGLAYCIGSIDLMPLKAAKDEHFLKSFEVNVLGATRALRALEKPLKAGRGSVLLFSSIAAQQGYTNHSVISAAKGAVEGLTKALAAEWAGSVRVNCIAPSLIDTPLAKPLTSSPQMREAIEKMHPIPRLGTSEDVCALAELLLTEKSAWITGQIFHVDGGRSTLKPKG